MVASKNWTLQGAGIADTTYLCSTDPEILDLNALNTALGSDMLWWATALPEERLKVLVDNCLIFGLYLVDTTCKDAPKHIMIGCARVITDRVTFGYLTDVYVLQEHQKRGLGAFLMKCLDEVLSGWPELRGFWILSSSPQSQKLYQRIFGAVDFFAEKTDPNLTLLEKKGPKMTH